MPDKLESFKLVCRGGLQSSDNHLELSDDSPGSATRLINFEPSLFGGYRRMNGYEPFGSDNPVVGGDDAEGPVLCIALYNDYLTYVYAIAARKDAGTNSYSFYRQIPGFGWDKINTGLTLAYEDASITVQKIRHVQFDFGDGNRIAFVDGVNPPVIFDGITWSQLSLDGSGTEESPGGDQLIEAPSLVGVFENHLFFGGDYFKPSLVVHSAPRDALNFTAAAGGGQVPVGFPVVQFKPFRDSLFVFGLNEIKRITADFGSQDFILEPITANVGCIARDSVLEIGGDLIFLAPDGLRPVAGTSRIGDVEIETISKAIQGKLLNIIARTERDTVNGVVLRSKSQVRFFISDETVSPVSAFGIIGGLTNTSDEIRWEFAEIRGIRASCATSEYVGSEEIVLHGDYDGIVYQQERGNHFDGRPIFALYSTPYLDFGETQVKKTLHKVNTFIRPEGPVGVKIDVTYDWGDSSTANPANYSAEVSGGPIVYGGQNITYAGEGIVYAATNYGGKPFLTNNVEGSMYSVRLTYVTTEDCEPFTIQGIVLEFSLSGRR
jgi:hypothetical protein